MKQEILNIIDRYASVSLADTSRKAALLDRTDNKYVMSIEQLVEVLNGCQSMYQVLEIDQQRSFRYETMYFDTPDLLFYHEHHAGKLNRKKVRIRQYLDSNRYFLEVKHRHNKGNTVKSRVSLATPGPENIAALADPAFQDAGKLPIRLLSPVIRIEYERITLVNLENAERVTIDQNISFRNGTVVRRLNGLVIAEVKQQGKHPSHFRQMMRKAGIREGSVSKYCLGTILLNDGVKSNRFKARMEKILSITETHNTFTHV
jgi:hypothetical protein